MFVFYSTFLDNSISFSANDPGHTLMLRVIGVILFFCSIGLLIWPLKKETKNDNKTEEVVYLQKGSFKRMSVLVGCIILYILLLDLLGFVLATIAFLTWSIWY